MFFIFRVLDFFYFTLVEPMFKTVEVCPTKKEKKIYDPVLALCLITFFLTTRPCFVPVLETYAFWSGSSWPSMAHTGSWSMRSHHSTCTKHLCSRYKKKCHTKSVKINIPIFPLFERLVSSGLESCHCCGIQNFFFLQQNRTLMVPPVPASLPTPTSPQLLASSSFSLSSARGCTFMMPSPLQLYRSVNIFLISLLLI